MKKLILKGSEWARGGLGHSSLLNEDKTRCCIGIDARSRGICNDAIEYKSYPTDLIVVNGYNKSMKGKIKKFKEEWSPLEDEAVKINDNMFITDSERVRKLRPIFKKLGKELVFKPKE